MNRIRWRVKPKTCVADCLRNLLILPVTTQAARNFDLWSTCCSRASNSQFKENSNASHQRLRQDVAFDPHFHSILFCIRGDFLMHSKETRVTCCGPQQASTHTKATPLQREVFTKYHTTFLFPDSREFLVSTPMLNKKQ